MIVGHQFGWSAVSTEPMDWVDYHLARQLLSEERVGRRVREALHAEDAEFREARKAASRG